MKSHILETKEALLRHQLASIFKWATRYKAPQSPHSEMKAKSTSMSYQEAIQQEQSHPSKTVSTVEMAARKLPKRPV